MEIDYSLKIEKIYPINFNSEIEQEDTQNYFKTKFQYYQQKVKQTLDNLLNERNELRKQIQSLELFISSENIPYNEKQIFSEILVEKDDQLEKLRSELKEALQEISLLKNNIKILNEENKNLKEKIISISSNNNNNLDENISRKNSNWNISLSRTQSSSIIGKRNLINESNENENNLLKSPPKENSLPVKKNSGGSSMILSPENVNSDSEDEEDIIVIKDKKTKQHEVKAGTLEKLVERLSYHKSVDTNYVTIFLMTYRSFTKPTELFDLLIQRYNIEKPEGLDEKELEKFESKRKIIKLRVANVLRNWLSEYFSDFQENPELLKKVEQFINNQLSKDLEHLANHMKKYINNERDIAPIKYSVTDCPPAISPKTSNFMDFDSLEVARQLTIIEHELFKSIKTEEFFNQKWNKKDIRDQLAPGIMAVINRFNLVSLWVATEIVKKEKLNERLKLIKKFIKIAEECLHLNNFNGVMEIIAGFQNSAIYRLKKTWEKLENSKLNEVYQNISQLMSSNENYKQYRNKLHNVSPPCVPYLGLYLTDITFIEEGNLDYVKDRKDFINFDKRRKVAMIIKEIQQFQIISYNFHKEKIISEYLHNIEGLPDRALYKYSLICEPKGARESSGTLSKSFF